MSRPALEGSITRAAPAKVFQLIPSQNRGIYLAYTKTRIRGEARRRPNMHYVLGPFRNDLILDPGPRSDAPPAAPPNPRTSSAGMRARHTLPHSANLHVGKNKSSSDGSGGSGRTGPGYGCADRSGVWGTNKTYDVGARRGKLETAGGDIARLAKPGGISSLGTECYRDTTAMHACSLRHTGYNRVNEGCVVVLSLALGLARGKGSVQRLGHGC